MLTHQRRIVGVFYSLLLLILVSACTSNRLIQEALSPDYQNQSALLKVPFFVQEKYHCGPAALAGIFHFHSYEISPETLAGQIYIPDRKGSLQFEIKAAARRADFFPYELSGSFENVLKELDAGNPVLVLQNLGFDWAPQWHYAVVVGYDLQRRQVILHSGSRAYYRLALNTFLRTWQRADNWALLIAPVEKMPVTARQGNYVREATVLESVGLEQTAFKAYQQALLKWPDNEVALIGSGNFHYRQGEYELAIDSFLRLIAFEQNNAAAWNNLAYALQARGCYSLARQAVERAIDHAGNKQPFLESLQELQQSELIDNDDSYCIAIKI